MNNDLNDIVFEEREREKEKEKDDKFKFKYLQQRLREDPEFRQQFENKRRRISCMTCLIRIFCCPCIAIWNLTKINE